MSQVLQGKRALEGELWPEVDDDDDDEEDNMAQSERDRTYIFMQAITAAGIPLNAQQDALSRLERAFAGREFDAIDAHTAVGELRTTAKHLWMGGAPPPPPPPPPGPAPAPALTIREQRKQQQKYMPKPCHHFLYSGGAFTRLYPVNPSAARNHAAQPKMWPCGRCRFALDL